MKKKENYTTKIADSSRMVKEVGIMAVLSNPVTPQVAVIMYLLIDFKKQTLTGPYTDFVWHHTFASYWFWWSSWKLVKAKKVEELICCQGHMCHGPGLCDPVFWVSWCFVVYQCLGSFSVYHFTLSFLVCSFSSWFIKLPWCLTLMLSLRVVFCHVLVSMFFRLSSLSHVCISYVPALFRSSCFFVHCAYVTFLVMS